MIFQLFGISWYTCKITTIMQCFRFKPLCREALPDAAAKPPADVEAEPEESAVLETHFCVLHTKWAWWWPTQACSAQSVLNLILPQCDLGWYIGPSTVLWQVFMPLLSSFTFFGFVHMSQDESYDLHDRKAFAKFLIDADIRLVPWKSHSAGLISVLHFFGLGSVWLEYCMEKIRSKPSKKAFDSPLVGICFSFSTCCFRVAHRCKPAQEILGWLDIAT